MLVIYLQFWIERIVLALYTGSQLLPPEDNLTSTPWWRMMVFLQSQMVKNKHYQWALFGDSISAQIGNCYGKDFFNFAISGMSLVSLRAQLKALNQVKVRWERAIIAMGTNDAWYGISDENFLALMKEIITLLRIKGTAEIILIPAFYSSLAASINPLQAAPLKRVIEINHLLEQVARLENLPWESEGLLALYHDKVLKYDFTNDGVHLNREGCKIYQDFLFNLIGKYEGQRNPLET